MPANPAAETLATKYGAIQGADFDTKAPRPIPFSVSVEGLEGTGKTQFCLLTCPTPIVYVNFGDRSAVPFLYDMDEERRKAVTLYDDTFQSPTPGGWSLDDARTALNKLGEIALTHLSDGGLLGGTFVLDSASSWWDSIQTVHVKPTIEAQIREYGKQIGGFAYEQGNDAVKGVISWCKAQGAYVVLTHQKKQDWDGSGPIPGKFSPRMNSRVPGLVEVRLDLLKVCVKCGSEACEAKQHQGRKHLGRFLKFAKDTRAEGYTFENPQFDFMYQLYTNKVLRDGLFGS